MRDRLRNSYILLTIPLLAWLLYSQAELRFYREQSIALNARSFLAHLQMTELAVTEALRAYADGSHAAGAHHLERAAQDLHVADGFATSYGAALNRRFSRTHWGFSYLAHPETSPQRYVLDQIRTESAAEGRLSPLNRVRLEALAADLAATRAGLPEALLLGADGKTVYGQFRAILAQLTLRSHYQ